MKTNEIIFILLFFILYILFFNGFSYAEPETLCITIKTSPGGLTIEQICNEINRQTGNNFAFVSKEYKNATIDIELKDLYYGESMIMVENILHSKFSNSCISKEGKTFVIKKATPIIEDKCFHCHSLKHVSFEYLKNILLEKIPNSKKNLHMLYYDKTNSIWINCKDAKLHSAILQIIEKYDVELTTTKQLR